MQGNKQSRQIRKLDGLTLLIDTSGDLIRVNQFPGELNKNESDLYIILHVK